MFSKSHELDNYPGQIIIMDMRSKINNEIIFYFTAFLIALLVRGYHLGQLPLADSEAIWALQALDVVRGKSVEIGPMPGYVFFTSVWFYGFGSGEFLARFTSLLASSSLVWIPYFFRQQLGRRAALVLAAALAIDPILVGMGRVAGSPVLGIAAFLWLLALRKTGPGWLLGVVAGFAALSGPHFYFGCVLALAWLGLGRLFKVKVAWPEGTSDPSRELGFSLAFFAAFLGAGTVLLQAPSGLGAAASAISEFLSGWLEAPSGAGSPGLLMGAIAYLLPALVFGAISLVRQVLIKQLDWLTLPALLWGLLALAAALVHPARSVEMLAWVGIPLWILAAQEIAHNLRQPAQTPWAAWLLAFWVIVLGFNAQLNIAGMPGIAADDRLFWLRWLAVFGALLLALLTTILVSILTEMETARIGLVGGVILLFAFNSLSAGWAVRPWAGSQALDLWQAVPQSHLSDVFLKTLEDLGVWARGRRAGAAILSHVDTPAMRWQLRNFDNVTFASVLPPEQELPDVVITWDEEAALDLASSYRGQDFAWDYSPQYAGMETTAWMKWLVSRSLPVENRAIIVWGRSDVFPGGASSETPEIDLGTEN